MFWSKIWFFVIAVVGAVALSIALLMPRPAQRVQAQEIDPNRVNNGRAMIQLLLRDNARKWVDLASVFARITAPQGQPSLKLDQVLETASGQEQIAAASHETARSTLEYILSQITTAQKPEFVIALDDTGRVVARVGVDDKSWGDNISGYFLVRDALRGYLRDNLWFLGDKLYRVAAAPVIARGSFDGRMVNRYVGAIVVGDEVSLELAKELSGIIGSCEGGETGDARCEQGVAFFVKEQTMAASDTVVFAEDIYAKYQEAKAAVPAGEEFKPPPPFEVSSSGKDYLVAVRQLPGEVAAQDGYYAVFAEKSAKVGFAATLKRVVRQDVAFGNFPWIIIILLFLLATAGGLFLMYVEADKPLRKLMVDAVTLGKGETAKLDEDKHKGRFGSIARSVNIALEKLAREAKASRKDLGAVLGPPPDDSVLGGGARSLPSPLAGGPAPFAPPPPSDFSFDPPPSNPVPSAPMHLGPSGSPPLRGEAPKGPGFDFDMPAPPPPAPPQPSIGGTTRGAPPPPMPATPPRRTAAVAAAPPPMPMGSPPPVAKPPPPRATSAIRTPLPHVPSLDDDILAPNLDDDMVEPSGGGRNDFGGATVVADPSQDLLAASADPDATYFREVFQDFVELKQKCGEPIDNLTYEKFSAKLRNNREQLINKYGCKAVKFQVYVKDGKAALKASPVK